MSLVTGRQRTATVLAPAGWGEQVHGLRRILGESFKPSRTPLNLPSEAMFFAGPSAIARCLGFQGDIHRDYGQLVVLLQSQLGSVTYEDGLAERDLFCLSSALKRLDAACGEGDTFLASAELVRCQAPTVLADEVGHDHLTMLLPDALIGLQLPLLVPYLDEQLHQATYYCAATAVAKGGHQRVLEIGMSDSSAVRLNGVCSEGDYDEFSSRGLVLHVIH